MNEKSAHTHVVTASASIPARPERVYSLIADYRQGHPRILPKQFSGMVVEQGGVGEGTVIRFQISIFGKKQSFRAAVTEPEPGRVLVETDLETNGAVTTFTVDRASAPADCHVTISTEVLVRDGFLGFFEQTLVTLLLRPMYVKELENLARIATGPVDE